MKYISILGATGSIGTQTLEVLRNSNNSFKLLGFSANKSYSEIINIINEFNPEHVAITDETTYQRVKDFCSKNNICIEVSYGIDGLNKVATLPVVNIVVTSIVGMIGLVPTINAIKAGKDIALANKETLVVGGKLVKAEAQKHNVKILPVDSEHGAIFQCLQGNKHSEVKKIILTASGGPFRGKTSEELKSITLKDALAHPKWTMGKKITIDSATLMNKGLEVIEAHWLFNMNYSDIDVVVHPESVIHSMVEYIDGSVMAQMAATDMKLPIQYAINYPNRQNSVVEYLDFCKIKSLTFENPDISTFKCLKLAYEAGEIGGTLPTILNGANEVAVDLFLNNKVSFLKIGDIIEECMNIFSYSNNFTINDILETDNKVRKYVYNKYGD
ncbi:1-deoxy-D-xylulose-5-phosphate reductoisomerase [Clostridium sp. YIM B02515]|uniref:1-deoxy-D-xylulose 5-phosphate reductoisomerase n=1 Tax=Clostridium rhizosphaerae TaxID=2803861 RepID=A0ABS1T6G2_9CLOT|nr:1-deoxy-D-xylulose-5-phosphate reductoisomerase [Clostridium rhizosphaerae]MBL4934900.1 1-deoxy-D-xylulose-5-phosphate reductoisomerase [Clostridium rhizosphaerae]